MSRVRPRRNMVWRCVVVAAVAQWRTRERQLSHAADKDCNAFSPNRQTMAGLASQWRPDVATLVGPIEGAGAEVECLPFCVAPVLCANVTCASLSTALMIAARPCNRHSHVRLARPTAQPKAKQGVAPTIGCEPCCTALPSLPALRAHRRGTKCLNCFGQNETTPEWPATVFMI